MLTDEEIDSYVATASIAEQNMFRRFARKIEAAATAPLLKRIAELEAECDRLETSWNHCLADCKNIAELECQLAEAKKDAERLDYITKHARCDPKMDGQHVWWPTSFNHRLTGATLREAIDHAMEGTP